MNIIIAGMGKVGATLVQTLINEKHDIVVIDVSTKAISTLVNKYDVKGVIGSALEHDILIDAGIDTADLFISVASQDETNLLACVLAKKLGAKYTIARVRDPMYYNEMSNLKESLNLDLPFNPEKRTADDIFEVIKNPTFTSVEPFAKGKAIMAELKIFKDNPLIGKTIREIFHEYGGKVLFAIAIRGKEIFVPNGDFKVLEGDDVRLVASESDLLEFSKKIGIYKPRVKNVIIIGGGMIAVYLSEQLIEYGVSVKIIENDEEVCEELTSRLEKADIVLGDGTDQDVLLEEGLKRSDACVTLTGIDEENVIISLFAKEQKVDKVITKIDRPSIANMVKELGLDTVVSPRNTTAGTILRQIRSLEAENGQTIETLYKISNKVEALEFNVPDNFEGLNTPIKNLKLKKNILICGIVRKGDFIIPWGNSTIKEGDKVIIVTQAKTVNELEDILR